MEELESQNAKIELGNNKTSRVLSTLWPKRPKVLPLQSFIWLPSFPAKPGKLKNLAKEYACNCSTLKRSYRKPGPENSFENCH